PEGSSSQTTSTQSRAEKARARTAKAREARARKAAERKTSNNTDGTRKSARITELAEEANQERLESELSSELDEVNMRDLERQLEAHRGDQDYQPSSPPAQAEDSRKRKQPHSEDLSLSIRSSGKRKIYSRKSSTSRHQ
ncbi:hypothetical protein PENSUB_1795, partial [Penicillium subrubescens]